MSNRLAPAATERSAPSAGALLELRDLRREFPAGEETIAVLKNVNLDIRAGEMVAIVGASGSGKSTLMNILGCLDRPSGGTYRVAGRETGRLGPDELAELRREHFGFIFQRYHLLSDLTALGNVETPAIYAGKDRPTRRGRATALLTRLGLADRLTHRPGQLSGGQQQRVSIARALMNGGEVILADEPTGALDSHSGQEVMAILKELHAEGHTVIIVTHDMQVAEHAQRIIEISDGEIIADRRRTDDVAAKPARPASPAKRAFGARRLGALWDRFAEAAHMAVLAMMAHRLRTFLTMLGIIIGITAVISVVALGTGSQQQILKDISAIGTNTLDIFPGSDFGDEKSATIRTLLPRDADALARQPFVDSVTPIVSGATTLRYRNVSVSGMLNGVGAQFFQVRDMQMEMGRRFDTDAVRQLAQDAVIDQNTYQKLFGDGTDHSGVDPIGQVIFIGNVPIRVVAVAAAKTSAFGNNENLNVYIPYTTAMSRVLGQNYLKRITVRIDDAVSAEAAQQGIEKLLLQRHGIKDFYVFNTSSIRETIQSTTATMTLLISAIAVISLIVGGIGVMNIMLVSVTERTKEIGVRMAVGARRSDIMQQFLIEATLICLTGGALGVGLALLVGVAFQQAGSPFTLVFSNASIVAAFATSTLIGITFGFLPARNAARLDPVEALARD